MTKRANGDGDIWPRKNKAGQITSYRGAYYGPDGKRRYVSGKTKEDARRNLRKARGNADRGIVSDGGNVKLAAYLARWLNDSVRGSVKPITHQSYEMLVNKHIVSAMGNVRLSNLTPAHLQSFYRSNWTPDYRLARSSAYTSSCIGRSSKRCGGGSCRATWRKPWTRRRSRRRTLPPSLPARPARSSKPPAGTGSKRSTYWPYTRG